MSASMAYPACPDIPVKLLPGPATTGVYKTGMTSKIYQVDGSVLGRCKSPSAYLEYFICYSHQSNLSRDR